MTKTSSKVMLLALLLVLLVETIAFAQGNTQTMGVSCVIPAIPGVNAPPEEKQTLGEQKPVVREQNIQPQQENQQEPSYGFGYIESQTIALPAYVIAEDTQEVRTAEQEKTPQVVLVRTFYSR